MTPLLTTPEVAARNVVCQWSGRGVRDFVAYSCDRLSDEPISDADIVPVKVAKDSREACETWSCNCPWYFIRTAAGIILGRPGEADAFLCRKFSWRFIEAFVDAPFPKAQK